MSNGKVVITGGAGFVGSQVGHALWRDGTPVVLLDNMSYGHLDNLIVNGAPFGEFVGKDIRSSDLRRHFEGADTVYHFAGIAALPVCQADPLLAYDVNTGGTANVLEVARRAGVRRVIFSSTSAVYENSPKLPQAESDPVAPNLVYSMTKYAAEAVCQAYAKNYGMDIIVCRFFNVYGPHQDMKRKSPPFTSYVARELHAGRQPVLYNRSEARRDYIHVSDVIELLLRMHKSQRRYAAEIFNLGTGKAYSVPQLYAEFQRISGKNIEAVYRDPETFWNNYTELFEGQGLSRERVKKEVYKDSAADMSKTQAEFDWKPQVDMATGLASVYQYAVDHAG
jgi:nucleoside-diphosphate-sugar epimerase